VFGWVVESTSLDDLEDITEGIPVEGAMVNVDGQLMVTTDSDGYFEAMVEPGTTDLHAAKTGFYDGGNECEVGDGGEVECNILMTPMPNEAVDPGDADEEVPLYGCNCSSTGNTNPIALLPLLALLGLAAARRRRQM
jgi:MYXO-CTERM domain-containing protein